MKKENEEAVEETVEEAVEETVEEAVEEVLDDSIGVKTEEGDLIYAELMSKNFLLYATSVLTDRALPDVRDGLLPVQRRILLAMWDRKLRHNVAYAKSARIVGDTMGQYHPHGDSSIYGALVRMAQPFSLRAPLIDGHGGFGSIDDDPAAAMRYTEARLTALAEHLLNDLDPQILPDDYGRNFDESKLEPHVLPAAFPNLLINGAIGIAVGMTCKMLPHNPAEVLALCQWRLANPDAPSEDILDHLSGPDFPTGGMIVKNEALREAYLTGEGKITALGEAHIEDAPGGKQEIVITSLPWGVMKGSSSGSGLLQVIAKQWSDGRYPEMTDMNDYSTDDIRVVIELKRGSNARAVLQRLYKYTRLRETYGLQQNILVGGQPRTLGIPEIVDQFLTFRRQVLINRAKKRISEIEERLFKLDAYIKALSQIDAVVATIKKSKDRQSAKPALCKLLKIDDRAAQWIVEMALGSLTALDQFQLQEEAEKLRDELSQWQKFIKTEAMVTEAMDGEFEALSNEFGTPRQSKLIDEEGEEEEAMDFSVPAEDCLLFMSREGQALLGQGTISGGASLNLSSGDSLAVVAAARSDQDWLVFSDLGKVYKLHLADLPIESKRHRGVSLSTILGMQGDEKVVGAYQQSKDRPGDALIVYQSGHVKKISFKEFNSAHVSGIACAKPAAGDCVRFVFDCPEKSSIILLDESGKALRFDTGLFRSMGRAAYGVRGMKLSGDGIAAAAVSCDTDQVLLATSTRFAKRILVSDIPSKGRGGGGVTLMKPGGKYGVPRHLVKMEADWQLLLSGDDGKVRHLSGDKVREGQRATVPKPFDAGEGVLSIRAVPASF